jgi:glycosyltransferase involved in cell wall biosynthesis
MRRPLVTIGITAFNAENTIEPALRSAVLQSWHPTEIIVVDDASTDRTCAKIEGVARSRSNVTLLRNDTNAGVAVSRNRVIESARGEFIAFFDDDDVSLSERLEMQYERMLEYEQDFAGAAPVICHSAREQIYPDGRRRIEGTLGTIRGRRAPAGLPIVYRVLTGAALEDGYGSCATSSQMGRLSTYRRLGGFDPLFRRSEDTEFCIRFARAGGHFVGVERPLVIQTMTKTSDKQLDRERQFMLMILEKHRDVFENRALYDFSRQWVSLKYSWLGDRPMDCARRLAKLGLLHPVLTLRRSFASLRSLDSNRTTRRFFRR